MNVLDHPLWRLSHDGRKPLVAKNFTVRRHTLIVAGWTARVRRARTGYAWDGGLYRAPIRAPEPVASVNPAEIAT